MKKVIYSKFSNERDKKFNIRTDILCDEEGNKYVVKAPTNVESQEHVANLLKIEQRLYKKFEKSILMPNKAVKEGDGVQFEFLSGKVLSEILDECIKEKKHEEFFSLIGQYVLEIKKVYGNQKFQQSEDFVAVFGTIDLPDGLLGDSYIDIDIIFPNIIVENGKWNVIDYEWTFDFCIPVNFLIYRALRYYMFLVEERREILGDDIYKKYDISEEEIEAYDKMEQRFQAYVFGKHESLVEINIKSGKKKTGLDDLINSVRENERKTQLLMEQHYEEIRELNLKNAELAGLLRESQGREIEARQTIEAIRNSISWKVSAPVRFAGKMARKIGILYFVGKHVKLLMRLGWKEYWKAVAVSWRTRIGKVETHEDIKIEDVETLNDVNATIMQDIPALETCNKKIAVHIHLYYTDLLGEFLGYLKNIPFKFDVYISCREGENVKRITKMVKQLKHVKNVKVKALPNRGRDIAPLFVWFAKDIVKYDYFLHVHSKKSLYTGTERQGWRQYSLNSLMGSEEIVRKIFWLFENEERVGLIYPDNHEEVPMQAYMWLANEGKGREFLNRINVPFEDGVFMYPAGSFYWARKDAVKKLFDLNLTIEDFDEEAGQTDGTLAHVIERATGLLIKNENYRNAIIDYREGVVRWNVSLKAFRSYLDATKDDILNSLMQYDVISFDIFDTLITRGVLHPDDIFELMRLRVKTMFSLDIDFLKVRKDAEWEVNKRKGAYTNIHDIYEEFEKSVGVSHEVAQQIKQLEIDLEHNLILPRSDMKDIYNKLKRAGKHIILVSDMYLTSAIIKGLLAKCGYEECDEIWVSCECGLRKDQDTIWDVVLPKYQGKRFIHVGDNSRSDWQTLVDRRVESFWIMSATTEWKLSPYYEKFCAYDNGEIINSLLLGMTINGGMFNSPFVLDRNAQPEMRNSRNWGASVFGPLFYKFSMWLDKEIPDDGIIAFLAREGYVLEPIYLKIMQGLGKEPKKHHYLLTSRRAVTVAGVKNWSDVRDIVSKLYNGSISNMLKARLGIDMPEGVDDKNIILYEDKSEVIDEVMEVVKLQSVQLFDRVEKERDAYLKYVRSLVPEQDWDKITVVDVGYSGTIQYYLAKLLEKNVGGRYLAIFGERKPARLGCECEGLYDPETDFNKVLHPTQLFLEAVLQAPMGQLIHFVETKNGVEPLHKPDENVDNNIIELQRGILEYCEMFATALKDTNQDILNTGNLVEDIYTVLVDGKIMSQELADIFSVEDDYCSNGVLRFNKDLNCWN